MSPSRPAGFALFSSHLPNFRNPRTVPVGMTLSPSSKPISLNTHRWKVPNATWPANSPKIFISSIRRRSTSCSLPLCKIVQLFQELFLPPPPAHPPPYHHHRQHQHNPIIQSYRYKFHNKHPREQNVGDMLLPISPLSLISAWRL